MMIVASFVILISFCITGGKTEECQPPTGVMAEDVGAHGVHVTWELPPDTACRIGFRVSFTPERGGGTLSTRAGGLSVSDYTVLGLQCNTAYIFKVGSIAQDGITVTWSEGVRALAGGPRNFSAAVVSSTSVRLTWKPPESPCNESITGYEVTYTYSKCGTPGNGSPPALTGVEYTIIDHLEEDTQYQFRLRAVGEDFTDPVSVRTLTTIPNGVPQSLMAETANSNSIIISWTEVECSEQNGPITHYIIQYGTSCDDLQTENTRDNSTLSYTISDVTPNTEYIIQVAAANMYGRGPFSEPAIKVSTAAEGATPPAVTTTQCPTVEVSPTTTVKEGTISSTYTLDVKGTETYFSPQVTGLTTNTSFISPEQQCSSCWPVTGGVIAVTVVVETVIVTVLTIVILYLWRSYRKLKQQRIKRPPDISVMECVAYGEIKPEPPHEPIYEEPQ